MVRSLPFEVSENKTKLAWDTSAADSVQANIRVNRHLKRSLFVPCMLGALPFDTELEATPLALGYSLTVYSLLVAISVFSATTLDREDYKTPVEYYLDVGEIIVVTSMPLSIYASLWRGRRSVRSIAGGLGRGDRDLGGARLGLLVAESLSALILLVAVTWLYLVFLPLTNVGQVIYVPALTLPYLYVSLASTPFHAAARWVGGRFSALSRRLAASRSSVRRLRSLVDSHAALCDWAADLHRIFAVPVLLITLGVFNVAVSNGLVLVKRILYLLNTGNLDEPLLELTNVLWTTMWLLEEGRIVATCVGVVSRSKEFNRVLFELMIEDKTNQLAKNEKLQLHIAMKREAYFSACGLFPIDYTLIHSMLAAATTYLVILVQFDQMNQND